MLMKQLTGGTVGGGAQVKSATGITVDSASVGKHQECGFQPTKVYVCMQYGTNYLWWLIYDEELNLNTSVLRGSSGNTVESATTYITIDSTGFSIKAANAGWVSSQTNVYTFIATT